MNSELLTLNSQDLETIIAKSNCSCHFINPNKTRIILWKERSANSELSSKEVKDQVVTYYLRIGSQKFISYPLTDKNGETYWKFNAFSELSQKEAVSNSTDPNPIVKTAELKHHGERIDSEPTN